MGYALECNIGNAIAGSTPAYCLFNAGSGEHLFANSWLERSPLHLPSTDWVNEGLDLMFN